MSQELPRRRFRRSRDRAVIGGVCGGLADYFGFNLKVTRLIAIIAFFAAMPATIIAYLACVVLVPPEPHRSTPAPAAPDPEFRRELRSSPSQTMSDVRSRFKTLNRRLARLEKYVTSSRYQLDREFQSLKD